MLKLHFNCVFLKPGRKLLYKFPKYCTDIYILLYRYCHDHAKIYMATETPPYNFLSIIPDIYIVVEILLSPYRDIQKMYITIFMFILLSCYDNNG